MASWDMNFVVVLKAECRCLNGLILFGLRYCNTLVKCSYESMVPSVLLVLYQVAPFLARLFAVSTLNYLSLLYCIPYPTGQ